jgi:steroid delta-isomerase-like uncharacterized protein
MWRQLMSIEQNKALFRRWLQELSRGNWDVVDEVIAHDAILNSPHLPTTLRGAEHFKETFRGAGEALGLTYTVDEQVAEGDTGVTRFTVHGTHRQEFAGLAPTGKAFTFPSVVIYRVADGKITDYRLSLDWHGVLQELGGGPTSGAAPG